MDYDDFNAAQVSRMERRRIEDAEKWDVWVQKMPALSFPQDWKVKIIPPFGGAMARFQVTTDTAFVSVYLDVFKRLGSCDGPYWEVYPYDNDVYRCAMEETQKLLEAIQYSINQQKEYVRHETI